MAVKKRNRVLAVFVSLVMVFALMPMSIGAAFAGTDEGNDEGITVGEKVQAEQEQAEPEQTVPEPAAMKAAHKTGYYDEYGEWIEDEDDYDYDYDYDYEDGYTDWWDYYPSVYLRCVGLHKVRVSWDTCYDLDHVVIYRKGGGSSTWKKVKTSYGTSWTNTGLKKNTKYYYKVVAYSIYGDTYTTDWNYTKTRKNIGYLGASSDYGQYGDVTYEQVKVWYKKGKLRCAIKLYNERYAKAKKFNYITIRIYHKNGKLIAKQTFKNVKLNLKSYKKKWKTFKFSYKNTYMHNANLRYDAEDYYMTYKIKWKF